MTTEPLRFWYEYACEVNETLRVIGSYKNLGPAEVIRLFEVSFPFSYHIALVAKRRFSPRGSTFDYKLPIIVMDEVIYDLESDER